MFLKKIQLVLTGPFKGYEKKEKKIRVILYEIQF